MLPPTLAERLEPNAPSPRTDGELVIYWMRVAVRARENPALDAALVAAKELGKPLLVYHGLSRTYRYASDRLHTFVLQGARDVQRDLAARGIAYAFYLQRPGDEQRVLESLAQRAALVVTDYMPVQPFTTWDATVAKCAPLWRVDASCIAPVWLIDQLHDRAFTFRKHAEPLWRTRVSAAWNDVEPADVARVPALPFAPLDLQSCDIEVLVAECDVDHTVAPVHHTVGGSAAAVARWHAFRDDKLARYATDRNDPLLDGNSRLSAYLHFGHLSPFTVAREAAAVGGPGAEKFLDELLTWRELAWSFCRHQPSHESMSAIPAWARATLREHQDDARPALPSWDRLARAQSGDALWDACQQQLLRHGELHNNLRMTWGKALLNWTRSPADALAMLIDLNHRYALDGRDPSSYGGILWCLGAFDRPFSPEQPIMGTVRTRPTSTHAKRLDVSAYARRVAMPSSGRRLAVAVIGAGVAGAAAARALLDAGHHVRVFDKGRGHGGRLSTRREGVLAFDYGAQYFTVRDERFARVARAWWREGLLAEWSGKVESFGAREPVGAPVDAKLVGVPGMSAVVKRMLDGTDVELGTQVDRVVRDRGTWLIHAGETTLGAFDTLVCALPAPQAATLLAPSLPHVAERLNAVTLAPCWAVMLGLPELPVDWAAAKFHGGPLAWAAYDSSKPGRSTADHSWVLHASAAWSEAHFDMAQADVIAALSTAFFETTGVEPRDAVYAKAHRWRYAKTKTPLGEPCLWESQARIAVCGDWCLGGRVEAAYLSGCAAAGRVNGLSP